MRTSRPHIFTLTIATVMSSLCAQYPAAAEVATTADASSSPVFHASVVTSPSPTRSMSLGSCFDQADETNREIISARWNLEISKAAIRIAGAIPNPQMLLQEGFGDSFSQLFTGQNELIGWTQQIQTAGKRSKQLAVARANLALAQLQLDALRFDVHNRVRRAYAEQAAAEAYADLIEAEREVGLRLVQIADKRFKAGKAAYSEVLQSQLAVSQLNTQRNQAQIRLQQDSAALSLLIGERPEQIEVIDVEDNGLFKLSAEKTSIVPSPSRAFPELDQLLTTAFQSRPDLKAAKQQVFANRKALALAKAQRIPDLYAGGGYAWAQFGRHQPPGLTPEPNSIGQGAFFNVQFENPLFYQHQGEIKQALGTLKQSERQLELQECQTATDVVTAYNEVSVARKNIFLFQNNLLPTAHDVARIARRGYEVGATDLATAIVAQQQYQQTLSNYFDSVVAYQTAWADLEKAVGVPLKL